MLRPLHILTLFAALVVAFTAPAVRADEAPKVHIPEAGDFQADGQLAASRKLPLMVVFAAEFCSYCEELEADYIRPMIISGDYTDKVIIRRVMLDSYGYLRDFDGKKISVDKFSLRYRVSVTPTVVFLGPHGKQLVKPLIGISTPAFYGGELDNAIDNSLARLQGESKLSQL
ncbi:MAG: thioredoxin family protein [Gammaproteobacteria bacterium]